MMLGTGYDPKMHQATVMKLNRIAKYLPLKSHLSFLDTLHFGLCKTLLKYNDDMHVIIILNINSRHAKTIKFNPN